MVIHNILIKNTVYKGMVIHNFVIKILYTIIICMNRFHGKKKIAFIIHFQPEFAGIS